jgi:hypothetical protein
MKKNNNQFKSNPYVGWFRHSPDTTLLRKTFFPNKSIISKLNTKQFPFPIPHAHPLVWEHKQQQALLSNVLMRKNGGMSLLRRRMARPELLAKFLQEEALLPKSYCFKNKNNNNGKNSDQDYHVRQLKELLNGRLRGGGTTGSSIRPLDPYDCPKNHDIRYNHHHDDDDDELNFDANLSSSTVHLLTRFAYWLLLPFQDDEEAEEQDDDDENDDTNAAGGRPRARSFDDAPKNTPSSSSSCLSGDDDDDHNDLLDDYDYDPPANHDSILSPTETSIDMGISSQAEAYYAHYSSRHQHYGEHLVDHDLSRLDYVITQMDILRMQRNASRHLDVESIYQLPTQTYYTNKKNAGETCNATEPQHHQSVSSCTTTAAAAQEECRDGREESTRNQEEAALAAATTTPAVEGWSWMLVPTSIPEENAKDSNSTSSLESSGHYSKDHQASSCRRQEHTGHVDETGDKRLEPEQQRHQEHHEEEEGEEEEQHVCVICLEHFVDGDRLRILPCRHKFHVGCIDRWLSGSSSFQDCHTAGCPTCKKRPHVILSGFHDHDAAAGDWSSHSDGSLPGWAFAQLGSVMAAASADIAHDR